MKREEMVELRKVAFDLTKRLNHIGDYGAGAADIRSVAETVLKLIDHMLERLR